MAYSRNSRPRTGGCLSNRHEQTGKVNSNVSRVLPLYSMSEMLPQVYVLTVLPWLQWGIDSYGQGQYLDKKEGEGVAQQN